MAKKKAKKAAKKAPVNKPAKAEKRTKIVLKKVQRNGGTATYACFADSGLPLYSSWQKKK